MNVSPSPSSSPPKKFQFVGGALCLDFCNSVGGKRETVAREYLHSYADFLSWSQQAGLVDNGRAEARLRAAQRRPAKAAAVLRRAKALREAIYRIFLAGAWKKKPEESDLEELNAELARCLPRLRIAAGKSGFGWEWRRENGALDDTLGPIARCAADLLVSGETLENVRQCQGNNCGWLFLDSSRNHSRCWCDMRDCGNRAKVRRHRLKQRGKKK
jgi:predicted RNA-binding Zn ribbon-like protein